MDGVVANSGSFEAWVGFAVFLVAALAVDLGIVTRGSHEVRARRAVVLSIAWIAVALVFAAGLFIWHDDGPQKSLEFLTAYLVEESLSIDNLFVFLVTFTYFQVRTRYQHRVLFWGILGAVVMRGLFIGVGGALLHAFHWVVYVLGAFLVLTGGKLMFQHEMEVHPEANPVLRFFRRIVPATSDYREGRFWVLEGGRRLATPLLFVLVVIETTDVMFAVDSIPAVFGVTADVFIVYTSNIFAILGLRSLYFVLAGTLGRFRHLRIGLSLVLAFVGVKMLIADLLARWDREIPIWLSLAVIAGVLGTSIATSLWATRGQAKGAATGS